MPQYIHLTSGTVNVWENYTRDAVQLLRVYHRLMDSYVLDFFTEDLWSQLNPKWLEVLDKFTPTDLASFLSCNAELSMKTAWPLSLLAIRAAAFTYTLPRNKNCVVSAVRKSDPSDSVDNIISGTNLQSCASEQVKTIAKESHNETFSVTNWQQINAETIKINNSPLQLSEVEWGDAASELSAAAGQHKLLQHVFRRHLKPKKQHEVARLALIAGRVCREAGIAVAVDVGAGQGHLSRLLAYGHGIKVVCLEAEDEFISGAKKFDHQLEQAVEKMKRHESNLPPLPPAPRHTVCHLHPNMSSQLFTQVVCGAWGGPSKGDDGPECGLLGLHTCGDLGPTLLRLFSHTPNCHALVSVGCCYMKLTQDSSNQTEFPGYPMSQFVRHLPGHTLSYAAREVACHAIEMYASRLKEGADNLKVHCYRACLEEILVQHWPHHYHAGLRSVNRAHKMDFPKYATEAVSRLSDVNLPENDLSSYQTQHNLTRWMQVVVYYSLRLLLAPVVETVILLDRLLFLHENGVDGLLFPAFDPNLSPRNHVLVAIKPKKET
ncbi:hypothetical protein Pcinc_007998 [Petrolisthes cinctipes]|uniref:Methyltransferase domain-containing protein n=1 Tax=Petrolisthes cinctipes TaxID=88211 RepID=A0AAE1G9W9_PETCI|nr:hypothetical protein Pcinc_007998 [Petrolisthes cinctipes]